MSLRPASLWNRNQKIGQLLRGQVVSKTTGGYLVQVEGDDRQCFLECNDVLAPRQEVLARVACFDRRGTVLRPEFTHANKAVKHSSVLEQYDPVTHQRLNDASAQEKRDQLPSSSLPVYSDTVAELESGSTSFAPQEPSPVQDIRYRIFDLIPNTPATEQIDIGDCAFVDEIVSYVEGGMRTAFIKASCESRLSRFLILCYRGRLVGCTYGRRDLPEARQLPMPEAFKLAVTDLVVSSSKAELTDVPEELMLGLAALYLGTAFETPNMPTLEVFKFLSTEFQHNRLTGCIAIFDERRQQSVGFIYVHMGALIGYFNVSNQQYGQDLSPLRQLLAEPGIILQARIFQ